jgi:PEP-CTERM motif
MFARVSLLGVTVGLALLATAANAGTVYSNSFTSNDNGFSGSSALTTSPSGNQFVYFGGAGGSGTLALTGLAPGSNVSLSFDLYVVGSMDGGGTDGAPIFGGGPGDFFAVTDGATQIFNQAFANFGNGENQTFPANPSAPGTGAFAINGLGYTGFPQGSAGIQDAEYAINLGPFTTSSGNVSFSFFDNSNEGASNEFYGIDNVTVTSAIASGVPEPATWATMLLGVGMVGGGLRMARRRNDMALTAA